MKKLILAAALVSGLSGVAYADDADSRYLANEGDAPAKSDVVTEPFAAAPTTPGGCDEAAGSVAKLQACDPYSGGGGSNTGSKQ